MILTSDPKGNVERIKDMPQLKREIVGYLFNFVSGKKPGEWWTYKGEFVFEGKPYNIECTVMYDNPMFKYKNLHIEHKQQEISVDDMVRQGMLQ